MRIGSSTSSLFKALNHLDETNKALARSLERLSTGKRINRASDDAAALALSEGLRSQVLGSQQASRNVNDLKSLLVASEAAIQTQQEIVQRMRELALQAANGTLQSSQRELLETEFQQLYSEYQRITEQTEFNGRRVLDGGLQSLSVQYGASADQNYSLGIEGTSRQDIFEKRIDTPDYSSPEDRTGAADNFDEALDLNGDGIMDYVSSPDLTTLVVSLGDGQGGFSETLTSSISGFNAVTQYIDWDGDEDLDVITKKQNKIYIHLNDGDGNFVFDEEIALVSELNAISNFKLADLDSDGALDILLQNQTSVFNKDTEIYLNDGEGNFAFSQSFASTSLSASFTVEDFTGDGKVDIYENVSGGFQKFLYENNGDGGFTNQGNVLSGGSGSIVGTLDLDGDGDLDQLATDSVFDFDGGVTTSLYLLLNDGSGNISASVMGVYEGSIYQGLEDINADGQMDIILSEFGGSEVRYLLGRDDASFDSLESLDLGVEFNDLEI